MKLTIEEVSTKHDSISFAIKKPEFKEGMNSGIE
jgi:hypothetical protein